MCCMQFFLYILYDCLLDMIADVFIWLNNSNISLKKKKNIQSAQLILNVSRNCFFVSLSVSHSIWAHIFSISLISDASRDTNLFCIKHFVVLDIFTSLKIASPWPILLFSILLSVVFLFYFFGSPYNVSQTQYISWDQNGFIKLFAIN